MHIGHQFEKCEYLISILCIWLSDVVWSEDIESVRQSLPIYYKLFSFILNVLGSMLGSISLTLKAMLHFSLVHAGFLYYVTETGQKSLHKRRREKENKKNMAITYCSFYSHERDSNMSTCSNYSLEALASDVLCLPAEASNELAILLTSAIIATTSLSLFTAEPTPCVHT